MTEFRKKYIRDEEGFNYPGVIENKYKDETRYIGQYKDDTLTK